MLVADVGGTKTLFAVADGNTLQYRQRYENDAFGTFEALLNDYRAHLANTGIELQRACLAVAGPVAAGSARLTNRAHWTLAQDALQTALGVPVRLVNDFAAAARALPTLQAGDLETLQVGEPGQGARVCLGPGTGLGVAALIDDRIITSEGGHIGFAPTDGQQADLWRFLGGEHRRVTAERVCSGPGLLACYRYCLVRSGHPLPQDIEPADIVTRAPHDADAQHALLLFAKVLGAIAGDYALTFMARGGVFIAGGIPLKILSYLLSGECLAAFNDKAEYARLMQSFPVHVVRCDDLGLRGAAILGSE